MEPNFWLQKWQDNSIAFHKSEANPALVNHFDKLSLPTGSRVFVPLCGKTLDITWLLSQGYRVAGVELAELAIEQLFANLGVSPTVTQAGQVRLYRAEDIDIFVGNIFDVSSDNIGMVDAVYDRAALVALPAAMRQQYTAHLLNLTDSASQLLVTFEYDQTQMSGPPFSISPDEVKAHYGDRYDISLVTSAEVPGGLKGQCAAQEAIWLLKSR